MAALRKKSNSKHSLSLAEVEYLLEAGNSVAEVALILGVGRPRIYSLLHRHAREVPRTRERLAGEENRGTSDSFITELRRNWLSRKLQASWAKFHDDGDRRMIEELELPDLCPVLGVRLRYGGTGDTAASLDRHDPTKTYIYGNVSVISLRANRIKHNATAAELAAVAAYALSRERNTLTLD